MLQASLGAGIAVVAAGCGTADADVFSGATAGPESNTTPTTSTTGEAPGDAAAVAPNRAQGEALDVRGVAVNGEMVVEFTYTHGPVGKIESPYVAVWVENEAGELLETVAVLYEQSRRGARWIDHLDRWFTADADRIASGGPDVASTISSATRPPGEFAVVWDGAIAGEPAAAGVYNIFVESAREDGPVSLTGVTVSLDGRLEPTTLLDDGELSAVSVRIDV